MPSPSINLLIPLTILSPRPDQSKFAIASAALSIMPMMASATPARPFSLKPFWIAPRASAAASAASASGPAAIENSDVAMFVIDALICPALYSSVSLTVEYASPTTSAPVTMSARSFLNVSPSCENMDRAALPASIELNMSTIDKPLLSASALIIPRTSSRVAPESIISLKDMPAYLVPSAAFSRFFAATVPFLPSSAIKLLSCVVA